MFDNLLVSTAWLAAHLDTPTLRIIDIRGHVISASEPPPHYFNHHADYLKAHIPGALFVDWVQAITDPADPRHAQIARPERFTEVMRRLGIDDNTHVVIYDDARGMFAARLWWALTYYGHAHAAVLDGGWEKWTAEQRPVNDEIPSVTPSTFVARPNPALHRTGVEVLASLRNDPLLIDVRTPEEFQGIYARAARKGHIPGAVNLPRIQLTQEDGTMLPAPQLRARFAALGITDNTADAVFYCNGGVSASYGLLAYRAAGFQGGSVYDGSWKEWGNDESKPITP
ncbi:MAG: sulfurtransferase [bacterium]|nr:sulfurtransferase [bacterium]